MAHSTLGIFKLDAAACAALNGSTKGKLIGFLRAGEKSGYETAIDILKGDVTRPEAVAGENAAIAQVELVTFKKGNVQLFSALQLCIRHGGDELVTPILDLTNKRTACGSGSRSGGVLGARTPSRSAT